MVVMQATILIFVALAGTGVVLTRDPLKQLIVVSVYGIMLGLAFLIFQAPDVALSQFVVGTVALPLMVLLTLAKVRRQSK